MELLGVLMDAVVVHLSRHALAELSVSTPERRALFDETVSAELPGDAVSAPNDRAGDDAAVTVVRAIDRSLLPLLEHQAMALHPDDHTRWGAPLPPGLRTYRDRFVRTGRLDVPDAGPGAVLPRYYTRAEPAADAQDLLGNVVWIEPLHTRRLGFNPPGAARLSPLRSNTVKVVCAPFMSDRSDVHLRIAARHQKLWYRWNVNVDDGGDRVGNVLAAMDASGATIGVLPEASHDPGLVEIWRQEIIETVERASTLRLVVIGSGPSHFADPWAQANRALIIDRVTGIVLGGQDKIHGYSMPKRDLSRLGGPQGYIDLDAGTWDALSEATVFHEEMQEGSEIAIFDFPPQRLAVLVCEDLDRVDAHLAALRAVGVTHVVVPVLSERLSIDVPFSWEATAAWTLARRVGAHVVVSNSLALHDAGPDTPAIFCFAYSPDAALGGYRREPLSRSGHGRNAHDTATLELI